MDIAQVDEIIERLLDVKNGRPGKQVQLAENEIRMLCLTAKEIFMSQPNLLELEAPIKICGECMSSVLRSRAPGLGFLRRLVFVTNICTFNACLSCIPCR